MEKETRERVPTLSEYMQRYNTPHYFDDPRTPKDMEKMWYQRLEDNYYEKYGDLPIKQMRFRKEGE